MEQGLRQKGVLAPLSYNTFFTALVNVARTHFKVDKDIMDASIHLSKKKRAGGRGEEIARKSVLATLF